MLKKILIVVGLLAVLVIAGMAVLGNEVKTKIAEKEPEFRQYAAMTTEQQNEYIKNHFNEFFNSVANTDEATEKTRTAVELIKADPEALQAGIAFGRAFIASFILDNENILKDLSAEVHNSLKADSDELETRTRNFKVYIDKYFPKEN